MPFKAHSLSLIGLAVMHVSRLRKQIAAVPARLCNKWLMHMYGRLKQRDGSARCLCFTPARPQRANVFLSHQLDDWSRYFCSFIKTERWSVLLSSGNSHTERWLFQAYVNTYSRGVSGDISVLTVPSCWMTVNWCSLFSPPHQGEPVSVRISLVAPLRPPQHPPLPAALLPHNSRHHRQHHGQVQRHKARGESAGQEFEIKLNHVATFLTLFLVIN